MKHHYFWTLVILLCIIEVYSVFPNRDYEKPPVSGEATGLSLPHIVKGVIHVHSTYSDGGGTPQEIAQAANEAGLDFVVLTDHNNYLARKQGFEKPYESTDLFVEMEAATTAGHALSFFSKSSARDWENEAIIQLTYRHFLGNDATPNLFIALSHPSNIKNPWSRLDRYGEGLEVLNFDSMWQRELSDSILNFSLTVLLYPFNSYLSALRFFEIYPKDFAAWDEMTSRGPGHFGLLAHDTHSKLKLSNTQALSWPSYAQTFKLASNVLFLKSAKRPDFEERKLQYYEALREGRSAMFFQSVGPFEGNRWKVECGSESYEVGDSVPESATSVKTAGKDASPCHFLIHTPKTKFPKIVRLLKNGELQNEVQIDDTEEQKPLELPLSGRGTYRVEIWAKKHTALRLFLNRLVPYLFYNPIYVR